MPGAVAVAHFPPTSQREAAAAAVQSSMSMILSNLAAGNFLEPFFGLIAQWHTSHCLPNTNQTSQRQGTNSQLVMTVNSLYLSEEKCLGPWIKLKDRGQCAL